MTNKFICDVINTNNDIIKYLPIKYINNNVINNINIDNKYNDFINKTLCNNTTNDIYLYKDLLGNDIYNKLISSNINNIDYLIYLNDNNLLKNYINVNSNIYKYLTKKINLIKIKLYNYTDIDFNNNTKEILFNLGVNKQTLYLIDDSIKLKDLVDKYYLITNKELFETLKIIDRYNYKNSLKYLKQRLELFNITNNLTDIGYKNIIKSLEK